MVRVVLQWLRSYWILDWSIITIISGIGRGSADNSILTLANVGAGRNRHPNCKRRPQLAQCCVLLFCGWHVYPSGTLASTRVPLCRAWFHLLLSCSLNVHATDDLCIHKPAWNLMGYPGGGADEEWERRRKGHKGTFSHSRLGFRITITTRSAA